MEVINNFNSRIYNTFKVLSGIADTTDIENASESIKGLFDSESISIKSTVLQGVVSSDTMPVAELIRIGTMLILCLASFLISFNCQKKALASGSNVEFEFDKDHSNDKNLDSLVKKNKDEINDKDKKKNDLMDDDDARRLLDEMKEKMDKNEKKKKRKSTK